MPDIAWVETGAAVGAAYAKLREEATSLAKLRNHCLEQVGVGSGDVYGFFVDCTAHVGFSISFQKAAVAYWANDGKAAKQFAQQGRDYDRRMREKHHEAAQEMLASRRGQ